MSVWLITGGAGFIGGNFLRFVRGRVSHRLVVLDALTYAGNLGSIRDVLADPDTTFVRGDIADPETVQRCFTEHGITDVVHFAAESHVDRSILGSTDFMRSNIIGTHTLLEAARAAWGTDQGHRFLHVSTDEVYGDLGPSDPPFNEASPYRPSSPYAASKAASDHLARSWHRTFGLPTIVTNCTNNYGPWQFPEKLIPLMILNALDERPLPMYGDGHNVRDWLHVEDHCEAVLRIMEHGRIGETYCIGGDDQQQNRDVITWIAAAVDAHCRRPSGATAELIASVKDRPGHDRRYAMDASRLRRELGWSPKHKLRAALPGLVSWYDAHRGWADEIRSGAYVDYYEQQYGRGGT